ncbi:glycosyltransferase family 39 protein [Fodinicola acaciae]|uniref:glycosyltransferase family 39 protein n=1 Tax=Fodinicola acaciae TaxID=2681555 RepID=UPI0013D23C0F|nr:glycosyltransferase family 39 protein [Fodinicola acaciae]
MTTHLSPPAATEEHVENIVRSGSARWARPALLAILVLAAALYTWGLGASGNAYQYYSAAVLSGTKSWHAFFFASLDPASFITVDKPPLALWIVGLTARVFGFNTWTLLLPQAIEAVAAVAVLYVAVRRTAGVRAGLVAALVLTLTPITVAISRDNTPDPLLVLLLVLAGWAGLEATRSGSVRLLVVAAVLVGFAFNTKMLQAYLVVPALVLTYVVAAPGPTLRRLGHLVAAGAALAVSSLWWLVIVDATPAGSRPYIGGSSNNTFLDSVIGANGIGRLGKSGSGDEWMGDPGVGRMVNDFLGAQISWLIPLAIVALVVGLVLRGRRARTDFPRAVLILWGTWLLTHLAVLSFTSGGPHPYYTAPMAPALAALAATIFVLPKESRRWSLPLAVCASGLLAFVLLSRTPTFVPWLGWLVLIATIVAIAILPAGRWTGPAVAISLVAVLAGPTAFAVVTPFQRIIFTNPLAGPADTWKGGPGGKGGFGGDPNGPFQDLDSSTGDAAGYRKMLAYLDNRRGEATWLAGVPSSQYAAPMILRTGKPFMAMGGFLGSDHALTVAQLRQYVQQGRVRYFLLYPGKVPPRFADPVIAGWIGQHCARIDPSTYGASFSPDALVLHHCQ